MSHYSLEHQFNGGAWAPVPLLLPTATSLATTVPSAGAFAYRVTAWDKAGNHGGSATPALTARLTQNSSTLVRWWLREFATKTLAVPVAVA